MNMWQFFDNHPILAFMAIVFFGAAAIQLAMSAGEWFRRR